MNIKSFAKSVSLLAVALASAGLSEGSIVINFTQEGTDVVGAYSGTLDTTGSGGALTFEGQNITPTSGRFTALYGLPPSGSFVSFSRVNWATGQEMPAFGTAGGAFSATSFSISAGNSLRIDQTGVSFDPGYTSGSQLAGSLTWAGKSLADLGLTTGNYVGETVNGDSVTLNVGAIPEPSTYGFLLGAAGLAAAIRLRRRTSAP